MPLIAVIRSTCKQLLRDLGIIDASDTPTAGGSDTPWTENHDAGGFNLTNVGRVLSSGTSGDASVPQFAFEADTNTGFYRSAEDQVGVACGGSRKGLFFSGGLDLGANHLTTTGNVNNTLKVVTITSGVGSETVLTQAQTGSLVVNTGTTVKASVKLPATAVVGTYYDVHNVDTDGFRVVANTGQTITAGDLGTSASAGYVESVRVDSSFRVSCTVADTTWRCTRIEGTWRKDSTTSQGFAFTPTSWAAATFSVDWTTNTTTTALVRRHGDEAEFWLNLTFAGAPDNVDLRFDLPSGYVVDESKLLAGGNPGTGWVEVSIGRGSIFDNAASQQYNLLSIYDRTDNDFRVMQLGLTSNTTQVTRTSPITIASGDSIELHFKVPVQ